MNLWVQLFFVIGLEAGLLLIAAFIVERTFKAALEGVKLALKSEHKTSPGRLNLFGVLLFTFAMIFSDLNNWVADALSAQKPAPSDLRVIAPLALFGLLFIGSLIFVLLMERQTPPKP